MEIIKDEPKVSTLAHVQSVWTHQKANSPIYALLLPDIILTSAVPGTIHASLRVSGTHVNSKGGLHGTLTACLVDWAAGMAIASYGGSYTGVSTDIHVSYLAAAKDGEVLEIEGKVAKMGGTLAYVKIEISKTKEGERVNVAEGLHTKFVKKRE
ncbi:HotDog domain-containing protein [Aspergillus californicus]